MLIIGSILVLTFTPPFKKHGGRFPTHGFNPLDKYCSRNTDSLLVNTGGNTAWESTTHLEIQ